MGIIWLVIPGVSVVVTMVKKITDDKLDNIDRKLLNILQNDFPLQSRPFLKIASQLEISEKDVIKRIKKLKNDYIRRIGGIFSSKKLGYVSTLLAAKVDEEHFYEVAEMINQYQGVTHNYRRNHDYNLWFTLICKSEENLKKTIQTIKNFKGVNILREFPIKDSFKLKVDLNMDSREKEDK